MSTPARGPNTRVALLGCGTVGSEVARQLLAGDRERVQLVKILVRRAEVDRGLPAQLFTMSFEAVLEAEPDIVIELIGGLDAAAQMIGASLDLRKHVITANKTAIAYRGAALAALARERNVTLSYSAAVGASLPIIATLRRLRGDRVRSIRGVINGTCNFILTRMAASGCTLEAAVRQAQSLGLAEPDPGGDLSGRDSAEKLAVLAREAGIGGVDAGSMAIEGIAALTSEDHREARRRGCVIKLVAEVDATDPRARARVGPALLPISHPMATLAAEENGVVLSSELAGDIFLRGRGAGPRPTTASILGDLCELIGSGRGDSHRESVRVTEPPPAAAPAPGRRHVVRVLGAPSALSADRVLRASTATCVEEIALARGRAVVLTGPTCESRARGIADLLGGASVVLPMLEKPVAPSG